MWSMSLPHLHMLSLVMWSTTLTHLHMMWSTPLTCTSQFFPIALRIEPEPCTCLKNALPLSPPQAPSLFLILQFPLWKKEDWTLSPCTCSYANHPLIPIIANSLFESQNYTKLIVLLKVQGSWWALDLEKAKFCPLLPSKQPGSPAWCLWRERRHWNE